MWLIQALEPEDGSFVFRIPPSTSRTIGRTAGADFIVDAPLVSRLHCRLEAGDTTLFVVDLASTNGTFVNGERVSKSTLKAGDRLRVGRVDFAVTRPEEIARPW